MPTSSELEKISQTILGKEYHLGCSEDDKELLQQSVDHVAQLCEALKNSNKTMPSDRILVMVAIQLAHELFKIKTPGAMGKTTVGEYKKKMEEMLKLIDQTLSKQENLL